MRFFVRHSPDRGLHNSNKGNHAPAKPAPASAAWRLLLAALLLALTGLPTAHALPQFSRRYNVPCSICHTVAPALNDTGREFQANFFYWSGGKPNANLLDKLPISLLGTASRVQSVDNDFATTTAVRQVELLASDSFTLDKAHIGGYFVDYSAYVQNSKSGDLGDAYVALPFAGSRGQFAAVAGQFTALRYQYDPINRLTATVPLALSQDVGAFSLADPNPALSVDYFSRRHEETDDGDYLSVGVPFSGHLALNSDANLDGGSRGIFVHAFRRSGGTSYGAFAYDNDNSREIGLLATRVLGPRLSLLAAGSAAQDDFIGSHTDFSAQAEWVALPNGSLAVTARVDATDHDDFDSREAYPVGAITYYPGNQRFLRLTAEVDLPKDQRVSTIYAFFQL